MIPMKSPATGSTFCKIRIVTILHCRIAVYDPKYYSLSDMLGMVPTYLSMFGFVVSQMVLAISWNPEFF